MRKIFYWLFCRFDIWHHWREQGCYCCDGCDPECEYFGQIESVQQCRNCGKFGKIKEVDTFLYREHRGSLSESMATVRTFTMKEFEKYLKDTYPAPLYRVIEIKSQGYDSRTKWNTHIVLLDGRAIGFTDKPVGEIGIIYS